MTESASPTPSRVPASLDGTGAAPIRLPALAPIQPPGTPARGLRKWLIRAVLIVAGIFTASVCVDLYAQFGAWVDVLGLIFILAGSASVWAFDAFRARRDPARSPYADLP